MSCFDKKLLSLPRVSKTIPGKEWVGKWCYLINTGIEDDTQPQKDEEESKADKTLSGIENDTQR